MDLIHGSDPWIDPWIKFMDQIHGSEQKAGQNRLPYLVLDWELSYVPLGHGNVLRALCVHHLLPSYAPGSIWPMFRLLNPSLGDVFSGAIFNQNNEFHDL